MNEFADAIPQPEPDPEAVATTTGFEADPEGINHPAHYNLHPSGIECIEIIRHMPYNLGAVFKYLWRAGLKDQEPTLKDLKKALWYLEDEIIYREVQLEEQGDES